MQDRPADGLPFHVRDDHRECAAEPDPLRRRFLDLLRRVGGVNKGGFALVSVDDFLDRNAERLSDPVQGVNVGFGFSKISSPASLAE